MRFARVKKDDAVFFAELDGAMVYRLDAAPYAGGRRDGYKTTLDSVKLLAPCVPSKVVAVGINYRAHAAEMAHALPEDPIIFLKPPTSVIAPGEAILMPPQSARVDYEAEVGVVIGRRCRNVPEQEAMDVVLGYTCVNDVTARDLQKKDGQWTRAKGFDTFCPIGPWIVTEFDYEGARVQAILNGEVKQDATLAMLINPIPKLIAFITSVMTLEAGDVIATGTPAGISGMRQGDIIDIAVEGIGTLRNPVAANK
nr:fumarylacetoacetate hydrolase family protein [Maliibacterium massiliense]